MKIGPARVLCVLLVSGCEPRDAGFASQSGVGAEAIAAAIQAQGSCAKFGDDTWSFHVTFGDVAQAAVVRHSNMLPGFYSVTLLDDHQNMAQGFVNTDTRTVSWFDVREHEGEGRMRADSNTIDYPPTTVGDAVREWNTPRGQQVVQLVHKAQATCRTGPFDRPGRRAQQQRQHANSLPPTAVDSR